MAKLAVGDKTVIRGEIVRIETTTDTDGGMEQRVVLKIEGHSLLLALDAEFVEKEA
jgi:hypothetical protein